MQPTESRLSKSASMLIMWPLLGLFGGIFIGSIRARISSMDVFEQIWIVVEGGFLGSVFGAALMVLFAILERKSLTSLKKLIVLVMVVGVILGTIAALFRDLFRSGVL